MAAHEYQVPNVRAHIYGNSTTIRIMQGLEEMVMGVFMTQDGEPGILVRSITFDHNPTRRSFADCRV